jgi:two-component system, sensor histidine kinase PdtaS
MALIHEKLYQSESLAKINFGDYVKSLTGELFRSYRRGMSDIQLVVQVEEVALPLDQAVPCGLILNELITNAMKYAFPDDKNGILRVELLTYPDRVLSLRVADNGVGMPQDFDYHRSRSLGLQLVNNLVVQLDGQLELDQAKGTDFRVSFRY